MVHTSSYPLLIGAIAYLGILIIEVAFIFNWKSDYLVYFNPRLNKREKLILQRRLHTFEDLKPLPAFAFYNKREDEPTNIILLAYHRTGSSFTGELLSVHRRSSYFFEPLHIDQTELGEVALPRQYQGLHSLLHCDGEAISRLANTLWGQRTKLNGIRLHRLRHLSNQQLQKNCNASFPRVIKTINTKMQTAAQLLQDLSKFKLKIIHLVRDPRAMLTSLYKIMNRKRVPKNNPGNQCLMLKEDLEIGSLLPSSKYMLLRFEDLVSNINTTARKIFKFIGIEIPSERLKTFIDIHMNAELYKPLHNQSDKYYSTFRNSSFYVDHWSESTSQQFIRRVERSCEWAMTFLGYKRIREVV